MGSETMAVGVERGLVENAAVGRPAGGAGDRGSSYVGWGTPSFLEGPPLGLYRAKVLINLALIGGLVFLYGTGIVFTREIGVLAALGVVAAGAALKYFAWRRAAKVLGKWDALAARVD